MNKYIVPSPKTFHDKNTAMEQASWIDYLDKLDLTKVSKAFLPYFEGKQSREEALNNAYDEFCLAVALAMQKYIDTHFVDVKDLALGDERISEENNYDTH